MLSQKALIPLRNRGKNPLSYSIYVRDCISESIANIKAYKKLTRSTITFVVVAQISITVIFSFFYLPGDPQGFYSLALVSILFAALALLVVLLHVSLMKDQTGRMNDSLLLPNMFTILRLLLIAPVVVFIWQNRLITAIVVYTVCVGTDVIDGMLARARREVSGFGAVVDPLADVFITSSVFITLALLGEIPLWLVSILALRYLHLIIGSIAVFFYSGPLRFRATPVGKIVGVLQAMAVIILLAEMLDKSMGFREINRFLFLFLGMLFAAVIVSQTLIGIKLVRAKAVYFGSQR